MKRAIEAKINVKKSCGSVVLIRIMAPKITIPLIALAPDINGVWRTDGTLDITSKPNKTVNNSR